MDASPGSNNTAQLRAWPPASSFRISSRFGMTSMLSVVRPVTLPPGLASVATSFDPTGSAATANTIGIERVASFAARAAGVVGAKITSTRKRLSSSASFGMVATTP